MSERFKVYSSKFKVGFTLVDVLVGIFLMLIVFLGIFGAYQLGLKVIGLNERKITATQIAQGEIEKMRNLPYLSVGTKDATLPYAEGILDSSTTTILNGIEYTIETKVKFIIDEADGTGAEDTCDWDYKRTEVKVSWLGKFPGYINLISDFSPKDKVEEIQSCSEQPGGILSVSVFDAQGIMVLSPSIEIYDPLTGILKDSATPSDGKYDFPLTTSTYKVVVFKSSYSTERTYGIDEIAIPEKPHPNVLEGEITEVSFQIDKTSSFLIKTSSPWGQDFFSDTFSNQSKVSEISDVLVSEGEANLATTSEGYLLSGYLISVEIFPSSLIQWDEFSFTDEESIQTDLKYQIYFATDSQWTLIPDTDLPGNNQGFDSSPVDLSNLATTTYYKLKLKANFQTQSTSSSPTLYDWQVSWKTSLPTPISNETFNLRGGKVVGKDASENPVYKYDQNHQTDSQGQIEIQNLEWDNYQFSIPTSSELSLVSTEPAQPVSLPPDANLSVSLYLESQNSLLVTVQNLITLEPVFSATTTLSKTGFQKTQYTNEKGQTLFIPLDIGNYNLLIEAPGYNSTSTTIYVSDNVSETVKIEQVE